MKKLSILLLVLTVLSFAVFAQDESKGPEVTYGFSGSFEMDVFASDTTQTFEQGDFEEPIAKSNPIGLKATNFVLSPNVGLDWEKMSIDADATYDGFRADDDDWSSVNITTTWKDFYGFEIKSEVSVDNEEGGPVTPDDVDLGALDHDISITLDRLEDEGIKVWTKYTASDLMGDLGVDTVGDFLTHLVDDFDELGFELDTEYLGAELVYEEEGADADTSDFSSAWIEARNMFGMWTMLVNDSDAMELRLADLDSDVTIDREAFGIGEDNDILDVSEGELVNVKHTMSLTDAMTLTIGSVVPYAELPFVDWLKGEHLNLNLDYMLDGVGTIGVGALVTKDYVAMSDTFATYIEGPTKLIAASGGAFATDTAITTGGPAVWVDANLSELVEGIDLFASLDVDFNKYVDLKKANDDIADGKGVQTDHLVLSPVGYQVVNLGVEAGMNVTEALKVSGAVMAGLGLGLDHEKLYGLKYAEGESGNYVDNDIVAGEWDEKSQLATVYGNSPLQLNLRADYMLNETFSFWASNSFVMNEGDLQDADYAPTDVLAENNAVTDAYGFFHKNTLELGADMTASEASTISVSTAYDMFLGLPSASDFYADAATDAEKKDIDQEYDTWKNDTFAPLSVSVAFSFSY